ncbi:hypothetical protein WAB17_11560 [Parerythrobacter aurantius]|uniref:hypothetical protein n=1 Tax=Parerythrobacter aurantius TaxID=3127706 RepID=UPI00324D8AFE
MTLILAAILALTQQSMAPDRPPFIGTEAELNDKAIGEEIARTEQTRQFSPSAIEEELSRQATCLSEKRTEKVDRLLDSAASAPGFDKPARQLFNDEVCTRTDFRLQYDALTFRHALAASRYNALYPSPSGTEVDAERLRWAASSDQSLGGEGSEIVLRKLGLCVLQYGPDKAHALVVSPLRSVEEKSAMAELLPSLGRCMPPGEQMGMNRTSLRGMLADALRSYRLAEMGVSISNGAK